MAIPASVSHARSAAPLEAGYLSLKQLALYAGLSVKTLRNRLTDPVAPLPHYRLEGKILVARVDFDDWLQRYRVTDAGGGARQLGAIVDDVMADFR